MKTKHKIILACAAIAVPTLLIALPLSGPDLDIGEDGNSVSDKSGAIGNDNQSPYGSLSTGAYNNAHDNSLAVGHSNKAHNFSLAVGYVNSVNYAAGAFPRSAFAVGTGNVLDADDSMAAGKSNAQTGRASAVIGEGLTNSAETATVVGTYNIDKPDVGVRFIVGSGTSGTPSNALEVYDDGTIVIPKRQGDVLMGSFGDGS